MHELALWATRARGGPVRAPTAQTVVRALRSFTNHPPALVGGQGNRFVGGGPSQAAGISLPEIGSAL